ncbi:4Fe-4S dicluster domain-containing protein [Flammeovirga kamogawensis]|uniref:4Fe-4S binding protein n=1 Tax=Flammeovirga kamogawensis TaxID=373891 RepID=A0ABX8GQ90_9BACT|nr:4Fe-4S dicluster domain-containing protein [Flammeovirga kamogawensis]MBB6463430.1 polyferredoxin [Flammeovirga kamogawensis]QWG05643.1 4Fe-4S binding protein [Flammeovirga kamogawensis]TRX67474.1 4Fe-4S binding protein [Flammeovirga kamogawensis]
MRKDLSSQNPDSFRDTISTVDAQGKRVWLYPKKPSGRHYNARKWVAYILIAFFFAGPFIKIAGQPMFMLNILERKFVILGRLFVPQDFFVFVLVMIAIIIFIVLFTVVFGRVWCGWTCPQTVFMEMVFRRIEYWIEGDANQKRKLDNAPWTQEKILKKGAKHTIFIVFSLAIANMVIGYIVGGDELVTMMTHRPADNWPVFLAHIAFAGIFYYVFAKFREQACTQVCPYGRLQGVFLDKDSIVISYDHVRGEPRGKLKKTRKPATGGCGGCGGSASSNVKPIVGKPKKTTSSLPEIKKTEIKEVITPAPKEEPKEEVRKMTLQDIDKNISEEKPLGDCIDCKLCVHVCPTGIDIRNGTQLECVNCTACIDACDEVMDKIEKPRGLIRFASANDIEKGQPFKFTTRIKAYTAVLLVMVVGIVFALVKRGDIEATVLRAPGMLYQKAENGDIRNLYTLQVVNKSSVDYNDVKVILVEPAGKVTTAGGDMKLEVGGHLDGVFFIDIDPENLDGMKNKITIKLMNGDKELDEITTNFMGPIKK